MGSSTGAELYLLDAWLHELVEEEARDADGQQVEHDTEHHLVDQVVDRKHGQ